MLPDDLIVQSETLSYSNYVFGFQLEDDLLFYCGKSTGQEFGFGFHSFRDNSRETVVGFIGVCNLGAGSKEIGIGGWC